MHHGFHCTFSVSDALSRPWGVVLEIKPKVAMMSAEAFVKYASRRYDKEFKHLKVWFDVSLVTCAVITSLMFTHIVEGGREGSLIAAMSTGYLVSILNNRILTRRTLHRLMPYVR